MSAENYRRALTEQLADSLQQPLPALTPRKIYSTVSLPGKATAVIGMRRVGKTFFLHQLRLERMQHGIPQHRLHCIHFEMNAWSDCRRINSTSSLKSITVSSPICAGTRRSPGAWTKSRPYRDGSGSSGVCWTAKKSKFFSAAPRRLC